LKTDSVKDDHSTFARSSQRAAGVARRVGSRAAPLIAQIAILVAILAAWQWLPGPKLVFWLSKPSLIFATLWEWVIDGSLWLHLAATLGVMTVGYVIGCLIGVVCGLTVSLYPQLQRVLAPYVSGFYALPKIALAPLFIILFGIGTESKILVVVSTVFFQVYRSTQDGVADIDHSFIDAFRLMGATNRETTRKLMVPATLPWIFTAMRISLRDAFIFTVIAELFASNSGIGYLIQLYSTKFDATGVYAAIVVLVVLSVLLTEMLSRVERLLPRDQSLDARQSAQ
jgi:NitT/TauT family transport system permease protein